MHRIDLLLITSVVFASCGRRSSDASTVDTVMVFTATPSTARGATRLRVAVTRDAKVLADGREVTLTVLDSLLSATQTANGGVWLYQESVAHRLGTRSDSVFKAVADNIVRRELPVWFAHRPDFSDLESKLGASKR